MFSSVSQCVGVGQREPKTGRRFCANALIPSAASSEASASRKARRSWAESAGAGDDAEPDLGQSEGRGLPGDDEVAGQGQLAATAEGESAHRGDHRLGARGEQVEQPVEVDLGVRVGGEGLAEGEHLRDVCTGTERAVGAGDHNGAHLRVLLGVLEGIGEAGHERRPQRVQGPVVLQVDHGDGADALGPDDVAGHARPPSSTSPAPPPGRAASDASA